jgi:hypothetical protein
MIQTIKPIGEEVVAKKITQEVSIGIPIDCFKIDW